MADPFVAEIRIFGFNFAPVGWAFCNGAILPISQNTALFSLLGTNFGGNGTSNFALPNLGNSFALGWGNGAGLNPYVIGETGGTAQVTLNSAEMPMHTHPLLASATSSTGNPSGNVMAPAPSAAYRMPGDLSPMAGNSISSTGTAGPHENRQPFLGMNFCIALQGIFPPRS